MANVSVENYDFYCADFSRRVALEADALVGRKEGRYRELESFVTRALNVLHENGLYAFFVYLVWRVNNGTPGEKKLASVINDLFVGKRGSTSLLRLPEMGFPLSKAEHPLEVGRELCESTDSLFLAKEIVSRALVYVRYHLKGRG